MRICCTSPAETWCAANLTCAAASGIQQKACRSLTESSVRTGAVLRSQIRLVGRGRRVVAEQTRSLRVQCAAQEVLDLSEDSVREVLLDAKDELSQLFDETVGITGRVELVELDGPFVTLGLHGRFWHKRSDVLARIAAYMQRRIPDVMEVNVESEDQLDDSAENF